MNYSKEYLKGFIEGFSIQEPIDKDDFPEGINNINHAYEMLEKATIPPTGILTIEASYFDALDERSKQELINNWSKSGPITWVKAKPKLLLIGPARHGKDTVADIFKEHGYKCQSSSRAALDIFLFDELREKYGYTSKEEAYNDRTSQKMRDVWYNAICEYNKEDRSRLAREIIKVNDIYVGLRDKAELEECKRQGVFDLIIWVDASDRVSFKEGLSSNNLFPEYADIIIDNNGTLDQLEEKVNRLIKTLL